MDTEKTKNFWSRGLGARLYRRYAGKQFSKLHQSVARKITEQNAKDILDIACGPGDFLFYLSTIAPNLHLTGTDIAPGMVEHATQKLAGKAKILESDAESPPFPENSFDVITIMLAFHHFPNKLKTLQNSKKLLRPNGVLIIADIVAHSDFQKKIWTVLERITSVRGYIEYYTGRDISKLARTAGFSLSTEPVIGMAKRFKICTLKKI